VGGARESGVLCGAAGGSKKVQGQFSSLGEPKAGGQAKMYGLERKGGSARMEGTGVRQKKEWRKKHNIKMKTRCVCNPQVEGGGEMHRRDGTPRKYGRRKRKRENIQTMKGSCPGHGTKKTSAVGRG